MRPYRHQASEGSAGDAGGDSERDLRLKKAMSLLQQRKQFQRNLRSLQQQTVARDTFFSSTSKWEIPFYILHANFWATDERNVYIGRDHVIAFPDDP